MRVIASDRHRGHSPQAEFQGSDLQTPFEHPGRADAIHDLLQADERFVVVEPDAWDRTAIEEVHDPGLVAFLERAWRDYQCRHPGTLDVVPEFFSMAGLRAGMDPVPAMASAIEGELGRWAFETTTPITEGTYDAARAAIDIALSATSNVLAGERSVYGLCRPPGHHAPTDLYGGYCFFNNAAVAAHHAVATTGSKVTVLDIDYHHGNGTQQIFYDRDDVQYVSLHGDPARAYPYISGFSDECGAGRGAGSNLNIALAAGVDDDGYLAALGPALDAIAGFGPGLLIVSLGVDTYFNDPISDLAVTAEGFRAQGELIAQLALPTVVLQEGGYDVAAIGDNVRQFLLGVTPMGVR